MTRLALTTVSHCSSGLRLCTTPPALATTSAAKCCSTPAQTRTVATGCRCEASIRSQSFIRFSPPGGSNREAGGRRLFSLCRLRYAQQSRDPPSTFGGELPPPGSHPHSQLLTGLTWLTVLVSGVAKANAMIEQAKARAIEITEKARRPLLSLSQMSAQHK